MGGGTPVCQTSHMKLRQVDIPTQLVCPPGTIPIKALAAQVPLQGVNLHPIF